MIALGLMIAGATVYISVIVGKMILNISEYPHD